MLKLKDPTLLRTQCLSLIDDLWVDADDGRTLNVTSPATGELVGCVPNVGARQDAFDALQRLVDRIDPTYRS